MTKYKLLKKYPSLPFNWEVGMEVTIKPYEYNFTPVDPKYTNVEKGNSEIRNNPEYWEKVEELCVPVGTKFTHSDNNGFIYTISLVDNKTCTISWILDNKECNIGYDISFVNKLFKEGTWIEYKEPTVYCITEDGYEITSPMENLYWVDDRFNIYTKKASNCKSNVKYYRYRKAAENFIKCNKPVLNYQDVLDLYDENWVRPDRDKFKSQLTKLVKNKL